MPNNTSVPQTEQPSQARNWELTPLGTKSTRTFVTPTGHKVIAIIVEERDNSHVSVHVTNDTAFVNMGFASFVGDNHRQDYEDHLSRLFSSHGMHTLMRCPIPLGTSIAHRNHYYSYKASPGGLAARKEST